jgi:membrane-bound ClpP family serine protease
MNIKYVWILACILIIVGAILQIAHIWSEVGMILVLSGMFLGFIGQILQSRIEPKKKVPSSKPVIILLITATIIIIVGAILKITHSWNGVGCLYCLDTLSVSLVI